MFLCFIFVENFQAMIQATFKMPASELTAGVIEKIKNWIGSAIGDETEIVISVQLKEPTYLRQETREEYFAQLEESRENARYGRNTVTFESLEAFEDYMQKIDASRAEDSI